MNCVHELICTLLCSAAGENVLSASLVLDNNNYMYTKRLPYCNNNNNNTIEIMIGQNGVWVFQYLYVCSIVVYICRFSFLGFNFLFVFFLFVQSLFWIPSDNGE